MKQFSWNIDKNNKLNKEHNVSFEEAVFHIRRGDLLATLEHYNQDRDPGQNLFIINIDEYAYLVPFVETQEEIFLKMIIPSRKATRESAPTLSGLFC